MSSELVLGRSPSPVIYDDGGSTRNKTTVRYGQFCVMTTACLYHVREIECFASGTISVELSHLHSLLSTDAHADVSPLNHGHVVCPIPCRKSHRNEYEPELRLQLPSVANSLVFRHKNRGGQDAHRCRHVVASGKNWVHPRCTGEHRRVCSSFKTSTM